MLLHEIIREVIRESEFSSKEIGVNLGRTEFTILKWGENPEESGSTIPGNMIIPFCNYTKDYNIIKYLANQCGFSIVKYPSRKKTNTKDLTRETAKNMEEFSEYINTVSKSIEDGRLTEQETARIIKEGTEAAEQILYLCETIKRKNNTCQPRRKKVDAEICEDMPGLKWFMQTISPFRERTPNLP